MKKLIPNASMFYLWSFTYLNGHEYIKFTELYRIIHEPLFPTLSTVGDTNELFAVSMALGLSISSRLRRWILSSSRSRSLILCSDACDTVCFCVEEF